MQEIRQNGRGFVSRVLSLSRRIREKRATRMNADNLFLLHSYMSLVYMTEIELHQSYFVVLFVIVVIGIGMVIYFRKKGWL